MNQKQRRGKHPTSNINININLKVDTKHNQLAGKKITQHKEIQKLHQPIRPNHTIDLVNKKKLSSHQQQKIKHNYQGIAQERTETLFNFQERYHENAFNCFDKENPIIKNGKSNFRKRLKSKSLENLKVKYYARTPESVSKSHSKINSKSKSKSKSKKCKQNEVPSPKSFLHSDKKKSISKSKSKSKSPLISKKRSLQTFKIREDISHRQTEKDKSKDIKRQKIKEKGTQTIKKNQNIPSEKQSKAFINPQKKLSEPAPKNKLAKSKQKQKASSPPKIIKNGTSTMPKNKSKKLKKPKKETKIYSQSYLDKMATKIQSAWRSYMVRKRLKAELNEISNKIASVRKQINFKGSNFWQTQSNNSIIHLQSESNKTMKSESIKNNTQRSSVNESNSINPQFMIEIDKLRKKLEEQQDRFKMLQLQNNELKANLSKIGTCPKHDTKKENKKIEREFQMNRVVSMRIESEQSEKDINQDRKQQKKKQLTNKRRDIILTLPAVIKTEQSKQQQDYAQMKKKTEYYECSPKNESTLNVRFNKNVLKKLLSKQQEKLNQKYFRKSNEYTQMLKNQLVSPKTYELKCFQLQNRFKRQKQQYVNKYQEAQKALLLIDQLQQEEQESSILQKQNKKMPSNDHQGKYPLAPEGNKSNSNLGHKDFKSESPRKKNLKLFINVDQIDTNAEKYPPIISNNSHREQESQSLREEQDLSQLYHKVMEEKDFSDKKDQYLKRQQVPQSNFESSHLQCHKQQTRPIQTSVSKISQNNFVRGFQTNLKYIRSFYIKFCQYFRQIKPFREEIQDNITHQLSFDKETYLKSFRTFQEDSNSTQSMFPYYKMFASYNIAIPIQILNNYYQELTEKSSQLYHKETANLKETSKQEYKSLGYSVYQLKQYHDLALMDAFNESINYERPGGAQGSNLDDLTYNYHAVCKSRVLNKLSPYLKAQQREQNLNILLGNTIGKVINQWACGLCGFINDASQESQQLQQSKIEQIRMQRLTLMLEKALLQQENSMINTFPFRLAVKLQAQKTIFSIIVNELISDLQKIIYKSRYQ